MSYQLISAPAVEPITLDEAKNFLQIDPDIDTDDALIQTILIPAARQAVETRTGRALITQQWRRTLDGFPCGGCIELEHAPLVSVQSVRYVDLNGTLQTVDPSIYVVDTAELPGRVAPVFGQIWPVGRYQIASIQVNYACGYGDTAATIPPGIKHWMLMRIKSIWDFRAESVEVLRGRLEQPAFVDALLDPYCVTQI